MRAADLGLAGAMILGLLAVDLTESVAEAGFLRNGVRPGEGKAAFHRPPPAGSKIRIRPPADGAASRAAPAAAAPAAPAPRRARHDWFWQAHSPAAAAAAPVRWTALLATMQGRRAEGGGVFTPETISAIRAAWGTEIAAAARGHRLSEALLLAVIAVEFGGKIAALSPKGAQGLMQLIPATAARFGVADPFQPAANIAGGAAYLDWLLTEFGGDIVLALAGYNAGEGAVRRHGGVPPYAETRDYVVLVLDALAAAHALCDEQPAGPRAACRWKPEI